MASSEGAAAVVSVVIFSTVVENAPVAFTAWLVETSTRYCLAPAFGAQLIEKLVRLPTVVTGLAGAEIVRWKFTGEVYAPCTAVDGLPLFTVGKLARTCQVSGFVPVRWLATTDVVSNPTPFEHWEPAGQVSVMSYDTAPATGFQLQIGMPSE